VQALDDASPMTPIAYPDVVHAVRTDRFEDWPSNGIQAPRDLLGLRAVEESGVETLRLAITDDRPTRNRNPLSVTFRNQGLVTGLLYEPLARWSNGGIEPRLARNWEWQDRDGGSRLTLSLVDARWHDDEPVTPEDVAFTYRFVADTSLGAADEPVPAPGFRGQSELVESVSITDDRTIAIDISASRPVARRALTIPILPQHVWESRSGPADVAGMELFGSATEALRWDNPAPVGSGPLAFESAEPRTGLTLSRFDDHFGETLAFERLRFRVAPSDASAIELVGADEVDATGPVTASYVSRIARNGEITLIAGTTRDVYHVGYNLREPPLDDAAFRRSVGTLIDRRDVVDRVFDGFASPARSILPPDWSPTATALGDEGSPTLFENRPGDLDVDAAREAFRDAGYQYRDGVLLAN
ncbi:MAG: ABC transporter substrate-binding protein, partial [Halanaeroarchaeum sp.]